MAPGMRVMCMVLGLLQLYSVVGHYHDPRTATFNVPLDSKGGMTYQVSVGAGDAKATCVFSYETMPADRALKQVPEETEEPEPEAASHESVQAKLASLKDTCVTKRIDYWDYEICLESSVRQFHLPDTYALGTFSAWDGNAQIYGNGAPCEARQDQAPRQVTVTFACSGQHPTYLADIKERLTCEYDAVVGTPVVCDFPEFPVLANPPPQSAQQYNQLQAEVPVSDGSEDWFLQLSELSDGRFMCQAYSTENNAAGSSIFFSKFAMRVKVENLPLPEDVPVEATQMTLARHPGRIPVKAEQLMVEHGSEKNVRETTVASSPSFDGKLSYLKLFA